MIYHILAGSNSRNRLLLIEKATKMVVSLSNGNDVVSSLFESEPWGFCSDDWFINRAIIVDTNLSPEELLHNVLSIEKELGRIRSPDSFVKRDQREYSSREIDLDIIFCGQMVCDTPQLILPHPRMHLRRFVLEPLNEISPQFCHPLLGITINELLNKCEDRSVVRKI